MGKASLMDTCEIEEEYVIDTSESDTWPQATIIACWVESI
jgi:hypothetical protein